MATLTREQIIRKAMRRVGDNGRNTLWEIALPVSTTGGTWALGFVAQTTTALAAFATPETVQSAFSGLSNVGDGNAKVSGVAGGPYRIELLGSLGSLALPVTTYPVVADGSGLDPAAVLTPVQLDPGESPALLAVAGEIFDEDLQTVGNDDLKMLSLTEELIFILLGESQRGIDVETAQKVEKLSQQHNNLLALLDRTQLKIRQLTGGNQGSIIKAAGPQIVKPAKVTPNGLPYGQLGLNRTNGRWS